MKSPIGFRRLQGAVPVPFHLSVEIVGALDLKEGVLPSHGEGDEPLSCVLDLLRGLDGIGKSIHEKRIEIVLFQEGNSLSVRHAGEPDMVLVADDPGLVEDHVQDLVSRLEAAVVEGEGILHVGELFFGYLPLEGLDALLQVMADAVDIVHGIPEIVVLDALVLDDVAHHEVLSLLPGDVEETGADEKNQKAEKKHSDPQEVGQNEALFAVFRLHSRDDDDEEGADGGDGDHPPSHDGIVLHLGVPDGKEDEEHEGETGEKPQDEVEVQVPRRPSADEDVVDAAAELVEKTEDLLGNLMHTKGADEADEDMAGPILQAKEHQAELIGVHHQSDGHAGPNVRDLATEPSEEKDEARRDQKGYRDTDDPMAS